MKKFISTILAMLLAAGLGTAHADFELMLARVDLDSAAKKATHGNDRRLLDAKTMVIDDRKVHVIKVLSKGGRVQNIMIDVETGRQLNKGKD
ncbi:MAG: PepSY domain-containing protein [Gammaproteobacteria bacterium]